MAIMLTAMAMFVASAFTAWAATDITITFVRHGESYGNTSCCINTQIPGPDLTPNGQSQATAIGTALANDGIHYTSIYDSNMVRTQQTAAPFAGDTGLTPTTLNGLHEVQAGILEGAPQNSGIERIFYALIPVAWSLGLYSVPMLGSADATGSNFESRFSGAVDTIYKNGGADPVAFSHGLAIMAWTLMNVKNPDLSLMLKHPLSNTDTVTVTGNPTDGWTLVSWGGQAVTQNPALLTKLMVNVRDLIATPQMALFNFTQALRTLNISTIAKAIGSGVFNTVKAVVNFPINVVKSVVNSITTGTLIKAAAPPAGVSVPPSGSTLGIAGSPIAASSGTVAAAATKTAVKSTAGAKPVSAAATKSTPASDSNPTAPSQKSGADESPTAASAKTDKSDDTTGTDTKTDAPKKKSGNKKSGSNGAASASASAASGSSSSGKSGSPSGHHGGSK
ncbi:MAG: histidine phosphatase family protein [Mycobacterium sp.]